MAKRVKFWSALHRWSSLISTAFLLMLCITGLPLIFHDEIDQALHPNNPTPTSGRGGDALDLDKVVAEVLAHKPGELVRFVLLGTDEPVGYVVTAHHLTTPADAQELQPFDMRSGRLLDPLPPPHPLMNVMTRLHTDLFLGMPGMLFLGLMGFLLIAAIISGVVLYGPFTRSMEFGAIRDSRRRLRWLDLHNLLGITTVAWLSVVGLTGMINTLAEPALAVWRNGQLAEMTAPYRDLPAPKHLTSLQRAVARARDAAPGMTPNFVAFPGTLLSSEHHFAIFMSGETALSRRVYTPALVDAETGRLTDMRPMPPYLAALFLSQPLHFGDYGGLPLKIIWALFDVVTIIVLGSGLYLWIARRRWVPARSSCSALETGK